MRDLPSFLVIILDLEALYSAAKLQAKRLNGDEISILSQTVESIQLFCSSYALLHRENRLCVLAFSTIKVEMIYPTIHEQSYTEIDFAVSSVSIKKHFANNLQQLDALLGSQNEAIKGNLHSAMSTALTILNQQPKNLLKRILHVQFDRDRSQDYNAIMNTIFSAQSLDVIIDGLILSNTDSYLMQQISFLTRGLYLKLPDWADLSLTLHNSFRADANLRQFLLSPPQKVVDFKASCYCHQRPVEFAYMCSVCLTLLCETPKDCCPVCSTPCRNSHLVGI